jgi:hypothetical protein
LDNSLDDYFKDSTKSEKKQCKHRKKFFETVDRDLYCLLHYAVMHNNYWVVKKLLEDYNCGRFKNEGPLFLDVSLFFHSDVHVVGYNKETVFHLVSRLNELHWPVKTPTKNVRTTKNIFLHMNYISLKPMKEPTIGQLLEDAALKENKIDCGTSFCSSMYQFFQYGRSNIKALSAVDQEGRTPVCLRDYNRIPQKSIIMFPLLSAAPSCRHEKQRQLRRMAHQSWCPNRCT